MASNTYPRVLHFVLTFAIIVAGWLNASTIRAADLVAVPATILLQDGVSGRQLRIERNGQDITRSCRYTCDHPAVAAVDERGYVRPLGNGEANIHVVAGNQSVMIPVRIRGFESERLVDFRTEIQPLLSKLGCNAGGCHGKASGQNGFKLSLFGFDTAFDYSAITKEARGRRIFPPAPEASLFLAKASGQMPHGGGQRLKPRSHEYETLRRWIAQGAPASAPDSPRVVKLRVEPTDRVLTPGSGIQLVVLADYSDGSTRDVTRQSEYASNLDVVARVDPEGYVTATAQRGEAAIMARHMGFVAVFTAIVPHGPPLRDIPGFNPLNHIDELVMRKWQKLGLTPSPVADDATFIRRITLDLCGRLPSVEETRAFLADTDPNKREKLADRLLNSQDYPAYFALKWGSILRNSNLAGAELAAVAFHNWIKDHLARNRPYDEFVRGIVAAAGEWQDAPAINWYWQNRDDQLHQTTADVAQIFLGVRLQCAKCHHHPYERWGQADYYGLAGFFTRLGRKSFGQPPSYFAAAQPTTGERDPLTGKVPEPKFLDGDAPNISPEDDPRHTLVDWMTRPDNPFFARAFVNRMWGHFFARGLYHEVDDQRETNPPSNPELLDRLARDFIASKFDMKALIRLIVTSRVYQLSCEPTAGNANDRQNFARYYARRLPAEVLLDAVDTVTGTRTHFNGVSQNARAVDLPHEGFGSYFLDAFDRPKRVTVCECERSTSATLAQVLLLSNSDEIENKIAAGQGRIAALLQAKTPPGTIIETLYLAAFSRLPTPAEQQRAERFLASVGETEQQKACEDLLWTLLNSKEFMFNH
jgi:hypothetical protein